MQFHRNAKLGLAGRLRARACDRRRVFDSAVGGTLQCLAGDSASLVAALAGSDRSRACRACLFARSFEPARPHARGGCRRRRSARSVLVGVRPVGVLVWSAGATGFAHSTVWKVLHRFGLSRPAKQAARARESLRVAVPRRSAAHGHKPLRTLQQAWPPRHRRPLAPWRRLDAARNTSRLRLRPRDRRRPLPPRLRRDPSRRESSDRVRLPRACARVLR